MFYKSYRWSCGIPIVGLGFSGSQKLLDKVLFLSHIETYYKKGE